ncbi:MAG: hypothetical protein IKF01_00605 [Bacilli bacterium]|nr:hypothetical protein [Bacilli bacterium]
MESKHKNALIGALLAVVFVMAVGYAAFAQQLTINGTANITSNWDVHFDPSVQTVTPVAGKLSDGTTQSTTSPSGSVDTLTETEAELSADLIQPGDSVTFTLNVRNYGTGLYAQATSSSPTLSTTTGSCDNSANTCQIGHIKWTVTTTKNVLQPAHANADVVTVKAEYLNNVTTNEVIPSSEKTSNITVVINYEQVNNNTQP